MTPTVEEFHGPASEWDDFVRRQAGWTHFHQFAWRDIMQSVMGHECVYYAARDQTGAISGVLPLVHVRSLLFGHYLVSLPFVNYGGPLGSPDSVSLLMDKAAEAYRTTGAKALEIRARTEQPVSLAASHDKVTVTLPLPSGESESLWKGFPAKLRSQIRRPMKEGIEVRFGPDQVAPFYSVFAHHMRDLGTPALSEKFFRAIAGTFGESVWFGCAYHQGQPVAGGAGFVWGTEFEMTWASSLLAYKRMSPNMLLYWSFMERAISQGLTVFNFGRCTPEGGTHRFKRQWGGRDETLWWYRLPSGEGRATPSPDAGAYALAARMWRRLPLGVATALGPRIVRGIP